MACSEIFRLDNIDIAVTNFENWLDAGNEPNGYEEIYALYQAASSGKSMAPYKASKNEKGSVFIKGPGDESLALVSDDARDAFLSLIQKQYMGGGRSGRLVLLSPRDGERGH